jgi:DNA-binding PadR family transcriptional regulator
VANKKGLMKMRSPYNWAVLGLLVQGPAYGYELIERFESTYGDKLKLSSDSQIYQPLDALEARSLIEVLPGTDEVAKGAEQAGGPAPHRKRRYQVTAEGQRSYEEWLVGHAHVDLQRSRVFISQLASLSPDEAITVIDRIEQDLLEESQRIQSTETNGSPPSDVTELALDLDREGARLALEARLSWIKFARGEFEALA